MWWGIDQLSYLDHWYAQSPSSKIATFAISESLISTVINWTL